MKTSIPEPLPYHRAIVQHLQAEEPGLWRWFASTHKRDQEAEAVRLELLKTSYRLEPQAQPRLYELANGVRTDMRLGCAVTLYQSQTSNGLNAALAYLPGDAHVVLSGPLANVLTENEVRAVLAHELAHFLLFEQSQGVYLSAADLLRALAADAGAGGAALESARLYNLWTEIYADRWACHVSGDMAAAVAALIKTSTGLREVSAESYLRQADEIFSKTSVQADHVSHPEPYIRARALRLWCEKGDETYPEIQRLIEGGLGLQRLDMLGQRRAARLTRLFLRILLAPGWYQTEAVMAHAKRFFADFAVTVDAPDEETLKTEIDRGDVSLRDYFCYLMLDFVTVDRDLGDVALAVAIVLARRLGIEKRFAELAQKELTLGKKAFSRTEKDAETIVAKTEAAQPS